MKQGITNIVVITIVIIAAVVFTRTLVNATHSPDSERGTTLLELVSSSSNKTATGTTDVENNAVSASASKPISSSRPIQIQIPTIGVNARVEKVGLTGNGSMGIPSSFKTVGWYSSGVNPGNTGTAFMDGHVDNGLGLDGVFKNLSEIKMNDTIVITRENGEKVAFYVASMAEYPYDSTDVMNEQPPLEETDSYLKLITCGGKWLKESQTYDKRIVVTAALSK